MGIKVMLLGWASGGLAEIRPPTPDSAAEAVLGALFGSPSLVVSTFLVVNALWAWWSLGRSAATAATVLFTRSQERWGLSSFKVRGTVRLALSWLAFYGIASLATQLWAGSQFSPGQGGGLEELLRWSAIFGAFAVAVSLYLIPVRPPKHTDPGWAPYWGLFGGYSIGLIWAVAAFTLKGGPEPGDWWVCPALSCVGVLGSSMRMRIRAADTKSAKRAQS